MFEHASGMVALMGHRFFDRIDLAMSRLGDAAAQKLREQLRAWPQAENIHTLLTPLPVTPKRGKVT